MATQERTNEDLMLKLMQLIQEAGTLCQRAHQQQQNTLAPLSVKPEDLSECMIHENDQDQETTSMKAVKSFPNPERQRLEESLSVLTRDVNGLVSYANGALETFPKAMADLKLLFSSVQVTLEAIKQIISQFLEREIPLATHDR